MSWRGFFDGTINVARITALIMLKIIMFILNLIFVSVKFVFFILLVALTLGRFGANTIDLGGRRR